MVHKVLRDHLVHQESVMTGDLDHRVHLDLPGHLCLVLTGTHNVSNITTQYLSLRVSDWI